MCLGGGGAVPTPPNTTGEQAASNAIGAAGAAAGASQLNWAQGQTAANSATNTGVQGALTPQMNTDIGANAAGAGMYGQTLGALGQQLTSAQNYGNAAGMNTAQSGAEASTAQAYSAARQNNMQQLGSYGVDPSQMKSGALNLNANLQQAGAVGNAGFQASQQRQLTGMGLVSNALNQNTQASSVGQGYGAGANMAGSNIAGIGNQTLAANSGALSAPSQMMQTGLAGYGMQANIANQTFGNQMTAYGANQANANALMNMAGQGLGAIGGMATNGAADGGAIRGRYANGGSAGMVPLPAGGPAIGPSYQAPSSSGSGGGGSGGGQSNPMSTAMQGYRQGQNIGGNIANAQDNSMLPQTMANVNQDPEIENLMSSVGSQNGAADSAMGAGDNVIPAAATTAAPAAEVAAPVAAETASTVAPIAASVGTGATADAAGTALAAAAPEVAALAADAAPALLAAANGGAIPQRKRPDFGNPAVQRSQGVPPQIGIPQPMSVAADGGQPRVPPTMNMPGPWIAANGGSPGPGMIQHGMSDGTGIDDQVHAKVSVGEYIIPADVVHAKGKEFFDKLLQRYHVPAQQQRQQMMGGRNGQFQR